MAKFPSLLNALDGFRPKDAVEAAVFERLVQFSREFGDDVLGSVLAGQIGHITVHARVENQDKSKILLVYGAKEQQWKYPGGHIGHGILESAIQEASRALGQDAGKPDEIIFELRETRIEEYWNTPAHTHFEIVFRFLAEEKVDLPRGGQWFTLEVARQLV
jgi:hypothetical protein